MNVAGIDVSSFAIDIVLLDDDTDAARWYRINSDRATPFERARRIAALFPRTSWWDDRGVYLVGIEDPYSASKGVAKALGIATGTVAARLPARLTVIQTAPTEWKRLYTGKANASKDDVRLLGCEVAGRADWPQDAYDALGIACAVRELNNNAIEAA